MTTQFCKAVLPCVVLGMSLWPGTSEAQYGAKNGEWHFYAGDPGSTRYSALDQISRDNVDRLELAWRWDSVDEQIKEVAKTVRPGYFKNTPLMIDGLLYITTPLNQIAAMRRSLGRVEEALPWWERCRNQTGRSSFEDDTAASERPRIPLQHCTPAAPTTARRNRLGAGAVASWGEYGGEHRVRLRIVGFSPIFWTTFCF